MRPEAWIGRGAGFALASLALGSLHPSAAAQPPLSYEVVTETDMPHLEENLRYATRREARCLDRNDLSDAFWMLRHVSLQDCRLVKADEDASSATYRLQCSGGHGTIGDARWQFDEDRLTGTLRVRLGGKNMTFYQRITATRTGGASDCRSLHAGTDGAGVVK
ncbi:MAG: hypothetical protein JO133_12175 [Burkholderiaceae bacterium]|nr:hypothetical protein [Burkholderiaceae bacterium]